MKNSAVNRKILPGVNSYAKWYVANLSDGKSIVLEDAMLGVLKVGDSLFKKKGDGFYIMKQKSTGKESRIRVFQP